MSPRALSSSGSIGLITGILGVLSAIVMLSWTPQSTEGVLHYPFTPDGFRILQTWFFVHHFGLVAVLVGLLMSGAVGAGRFFRAGAWIAIIGMVMLTGMELFAIQYTEWDTKAANEGTMGAGYGISTSLVGLGMLIAGAGVLRTRVWSGWRRWIPLLIGLSLFLVVTPGMFSGYVIARLAIGSWMALFAALGWALVVETRHSVDALR
jgi:hypothetical protein